MKQTMTSLMQTKGASFIQQVRPKGTGMLAQRKIYVEITTHGCAKIYLDDVNSFSHILLTHK